LYFSENSDFSDRTLETIAGLQIVCDHPTEKGVPQSEKRNPEIHLIGYEQITKWYYVLLVDAKFTTKGRGFGLSTNEFRAGAGATDKRRFISEGDPVGSPNFQAKPVGDIETNVSISPNRISDSMSGLGFSSKGSNSYIPRRV